MGDRRIYDCSISFPGAHFVDGRRSTGALPFSVQLSKWHAWEMLGETSFEFFQVSGRPSWEAYYYDYSDLLAIDSNKRLWHRRVEACPGPKSEWKAVWMATYRKKPPKKAPKLREMVHLVASLGGYVERKNSEPGPQTVWVGMQRMYDLAWAWDTFGPDARPTSS